MKVEFIVRSKKNIDLNGVSWIFFYVFKVDGSFRFILNDRMGHRINSATNGQAGAFTRFGRGFLSTFFFLFNFMICINYLNGSFICIDGDNGKTKPTQI